MTHIAIYLYLYLTDTKWFMCIISNHHSNSEIGTINIYHRDFPGGAMVKNLPANAGDTGLIPGSIPGLGRSNMLRSS